MKYVFQFLIIIGIAFIGEVLHWLIPVPISASIYGIILLFVALELKWVKVGDVREVTAFMLGVMPVIFVPAAAGLIDSWQNIVSAIIPYTVITVVSTLVVMGVAGLVTQWAIRRSRKGQEGKEAEA
ncbi:MAG: CidA/LrgA family protein [Prevotella sp.]|nr:CidA/LrgA family protein [Prevotella sp.]